MVFVLVFISGAAFTLLLEVGAIMVLQMTLFDQKVPGRASFALPSLPRVFGKTKSKPKFYSDAKAFEAEKKQG